MKANIQTKEKMAANIKNEEGRTFLRTCRRCTRIYRTTAKKSQVCDKCKQNAGYKNNVKPRFNEVPLKKGRRKLK